MDDRYSNLKRFSDLDDVEVSDDDPDVRGWDVVTSDGRNLGEVKDLLVDTSTMKVRGLEVEIEGKRFNWDDNRRVVIPVESLAVNEGHEKIVVNQLADPDIARLPRYGERTGTAPERTYQESTRAAGDETYASGTADRPADRERDRSLRKGNR